MSNTLKTIPRILSLLLMFALFVWLIGKTALPHQRAIDIFSAICLLAVELLWMRNDYVVQQQVADAAKKVDDHGINDVSF